MPNIMKIEEELSSSYKSRIPRKESDLHRQAFFFYLCLGPRRSHQKVATKFECSVDTVKVWSRAFKWRDRISQQEREERDQLLSEKRQELLEVRRGLITLARLLVEDAVRRAAPMEQDMKELIEAGRIRIRSPKDAKDVGDFVRAVVEWSSGGGLKDKSDAEHVQVNLIIEK